MRQSNEESRECLLKIAKGFESIPSIPPINLPYSKAWSEYFKAERRIIKEMERREKEIYQEMKRLGLDN